VRELRTPRCVRGVLGDGHPYRDRRGPLAGSGAGRERACDRAAANTTKDLTMRDVPEPKSPKGGDQRLY